MTVFICGGCKNGKSSLAQNMALRLSGEQMHYYVATMIAADAEDCARIDKHIKERAGLGFETLEIGRDIAVCLGEDAARSTFLIDSVTALLANEMFHGGEADSEALERTRKGLLRVADGAKHAVFVSDYLFSEAKHFDNITEKYRRSLAAVHCALAQACDVVLELCAGQIIIHKGALEQ